MGFIPAIGMAMQAGGAVANYMDKKKTASAVNKIQQRGQHKVDANTAQAMQAWDAALARMTPEEQERLKNEGADSRMAAFQKATTDVPEATNVMGATEGAPALVKTEAAKQLGDKLAAMTSMMQAKSRLGGWDDRGQATNIMLNRAGQDISRLGDFSRGDTNVTQQLMAARAQKKNPLGDILQGAGSLMSMSGGMFGAGGSMAGSSLFGGSPTMVSAGPGSSLLMPAAAGPNWFERFGKGLTMPWGTGGATF